MAEKVDRLQTYYTVLADDQGLPVSIDIDYIPFTSTGAHVSELRANLFVLLAPFPELADRCQGLLLAVAAMLAEREIEVDGTVTRIAAQVSSVQVWRDRIEAQFSNLPGGDASLPLSRLTGAQKRLLSSISATVERMAWEHLRKQVGAPAPTTARARVFVSYRSGHAKFAEALARRLGQEGIVPWLDKWDILAGDSVPGKIEEGLRDSMAFIPVITSDYQQGRWATDELQAAIVKRLEQGCKIIPVLLEVCQRPALIAHLRYVDMSKQDPETFEAIFGELVDGIYGLELNPFR